MKTIYKCAECGHLKDTLYLEDQCEECGNSILFQASTTVTNDLENGQKVTVVVVGGVEEVV